MHWLFYSVKFNRETVRKDEVPENLKSLVEEKRRELVESVSNVDEPLGELFLG